MFIISSSLEQNWLASFLRYSNKHLYNKPMKNYWMFVLKVCVAITLLSDVFISYFTLPYLVKYYSNYIPAPFQQDLVNLISQYSLFNLVNSGFFLGVVVFIHLKEYSKQTHIILFFIFFLNLLPKAIFAFIYLKPFPWIQVSTIFSAVTLLIPIVVLLPHLIKKGARKLP